MILFIISTVIFIFLIIFIFIHKTYLIPIKYLSEDTRIVKNIFTNKYYKQFEDHFGWMIYSKSINPNKYNIKSNKMIKILKLILKYLKN